MKTEPTVNDQLRDAMRPVKLCPECNNKPITKVSFKGIGRYRSRRKTQYCSCGWSNIIPTEREAMIQLGLTD